MRWDWIFSICLIRNRHLATVFAALLWRRFTADRYLSLPCDGSLLDRVCRVSDFFVILRFDFWGCLVLTA